MPRTVEATYECKGCGHTEKIASEVGAPFGWVRFTRTSGALSDGSACFGSVKLFCREHCLVTWLQNQGREKGE